ncbi:MAG: transposase [Bacteroidota bacterium]
MQKKRFNETQIIEILKQYESGVSTAHLCREYSISAATFYRWKSQYSVIEGSEVKRLKALEAENRKLKELYADASLQLQALKDILGKKS